MLGLGENVITLVEVYIHITLLRLGLRLGDWETDSFLKYETPP